MLGLSYTKHLHCASFAQFGNWVLPNNTVLSCLVVFIPACWQVEKPFPNLRWFQQRTAAITTMIDWIVCLLVERHVNITYTHLWPFLRPFKGGVFYFFISNLKGWYKPQISQFHRWGIQDIILSRCEAKQDWLRCTIQSFVSGEHPFRRARKVLLLKTVKIHQIKTYQVCVKAVLDWQ